MERSLFERWAELFESEQDDSQRAFVMLDKQYRMVKTYLLGFLMYNTASINC
jgi:hypothetical protein